MNSIYLSHSFVDILRNTDTLYLYIFSRHADSYAHPSECEHILFFLLAKSLKASFIIFSFVAFLFCSFVQPYSFYSQHTALIKLINILFNSYTHFYIIIIKPSYWRSQYVLFVWMLLMLFFFSRFTTNSCYIHIKLKKIKNIFIHENRPCNI